MGDDHQKWRRTGMLRIIHLRGKSGKISLRIYEERENKVVLVAEDVVEYDQTPSISKTGDHWASRMILDLSTSDKVAENGLAEFLYVSNWVNLLKSILIFSKSSEASLSSWKTTYSSPLGPG